MKRLFRVGLGLVAVLASSAQAAPRTVVEWTFDTSGDALQWEKANHVADLRVEGGALQGRILDWDPFVIGPQFEIPARFHQRIEVRLKTDCDGTAEFFWSGTTETEYGGFSPGKQTPFRVTGDGEWHTYHVYPYWESEEKIILLRLDLPRSPEDAKGQRTFAVHSIRIVDLGEANVRTTGLDWDLSADPAAWEASPDAVLKDGPAGLVLEIGKAPAAHVFSRAVKAPVDDRFWVHLEMAVDKGTAARVLWVAKGANGMQSAKFPVRADGQMHRYNVDMGGYRAWGGELLGVGVQPTNASGATATIRRLAVVEEPVGAPDLEVTYFGAEDAANRAGKPANLIVRIVNRGGQTARDVRIRNLTLPDGVAVSAPRGWDAVGDVNAYDPVLHSFAVKAPRPASGPIAADVVAANTEAMRATGRLRISQPAGVPSADYVPVPRPVTSDYEVGAFYFPGWDTRVRWDRVALPAPERKPLLGYYDEGNPECVDWQIKWAVEHGISWFLVDWYWSEGNRHLEHWVKAFAKARYRSYLKWCVMWANHNKPGSHSLEDMRQVGEYWAENCFSMPEYYRIDDRPVVVMWQANNLRRDLGGSDAARKGLDIAREAARKAGYKGIYFVAMKWPEASTDPAEIRRLADEGYEMTSIYHYMHDGGKSEDPTHFSFAHCAESNGPFLRTRHDTGILPFLPNLSTGWSSWPWHGESARVIYGRTPALFRKICEDARRFADDTGVKRLALGPLNEWGEGSYIEPCTEYGFEMYDVVRDVFCRRPAEGWPPNFGPKDVGLGPYDLPPVLREERSSWDFADGTQGWAGMMGTADVRAEDGEFRFTTTTRDPALILQQRITAAEFAQVVIQMRVDGPMSDNECIQLFWATRSAKASEASSVRLPLRGDGGMHEYVLDLRANRRWRGRIESLRLDPCSHSDANIAIDEIRLVPRPR